MAKQTKAVEVLHPQRPIIFTGDWQADVATIAKVDITVADIIKHADETGARHIVHTGDVKDALSPIDGRVINAMVRAAGKLRDAGLTVHAVMGNHDYYATTQGSESWVGFLRSLGWHCYDTPDHVEVAGWLVFFFPFAFDAVKLKEDLAAAPFNPTASHRMVQVFHQGLMGAKLSELRKADNEALTVADLYPDRYRYSIGGHYHAQHCVESSVWYCGSPFCTRWDEANQKKGFLLLDANGELVSLPSSIPGWYDPAWPNFPAKLEPGARVRVKVRLERGVDPQAAINEAAKLASATYHGADVTVAPEVADRVTTVADVKPDATDVELAEQYVANTFDSEHPDTQFAVRLVLEEALAAVASYRRAEVSVEFDSLHAENFLSFETLDLDFRKPSGIRVVYGVNEDRPGRSNGAGKTALIQALMAAWFGETLKGQKHDGLVRRGCGRAASFLRLAMTLQDGRALIVERHRQPKPMVKLWLDGEDISTGKGDSEIKATIERLTGYTYEVAAAALYVDQREVNALLIGRNAEKKAVLGAFLNLERFAKGLELVKKWTVAVNTRMGQHATYAAKVEATAGNLEDMLATLEARRHGDANALEAEAETIKEEGQALAVQVAHADAEVKRTGQVYQAALDRERAATAAYQRATGALESAQRLEKELAAKLNRLKAPQASTCSMCGAPLKPKDQTALIEECEADWTDAVSACQVAGDAMREARRVADELSKATGKALQPHTTAKSTLAVLQNQIQTKREQHRQVMAKVKALRETVDDAEVLYRRRLNRCRAWLRNYPNVQRAYTEELEVMSMAQRALSRDGIPALVSALVCPRLNASAAYYAHLLGDGAVNVTFVMDGDELTVNVDNPTGGETVRDQSAGELRIAGLITTLALRDSVQSNVLFLDEMSLGLDALGAQELAKGISTLGDRYQSIFVTSHDPYVLNGLENYTLLEIRKRNGISTVSTGIFAADKAASEPQSNVPGTGRKGTRSHGGEDPRSGTDSGPRARRQK